MLAWATQVLALALHDARAETYIIERKPQQHPPGRSRPGAVVAGRPGPAPARCPARAGEAPGSAGSAGERRQCQR